MATAMRWATVNRQGRAGPGCERASEEYKYKVGVAQWATGIIQEVRHKRHIGSGRTVGEVR